MEHERRLAFKDRFVWELQQEIEGYSCEGSPQLLDTGSNIITLDLTSEQWTKIYSSILTGSDLIYPYDSHAVMWSWLKGVECAMTFCERMIECMTNDEATRQAIFDAFLQAMIDNPENANTFTNALSGLGFAKSDGNNGTGSPYSTITSQTLIIECDIDTLYGSCLALVSGLNRLSLDALEIIEVLTNPAEIAGQLASKIPILGVVAGSILEFASWAQDVIAESYSAAYTASSQEYWACKIFCLSLDDCTVTIQRVIEGYNEGITIYSPPAIDAPIEDIINWLAGLTSLTDDAIVGAWHYFILSIMSRAGEFYGATFRALEVYAGEGTPLAPECEDCLTWEHTIDLLATDGGLTVYSGKGGSWSIGVGWTATQWTTSNRYNGVSVGLHPAFDITAINTARIYYNATVNQNTANGYDQFTGLLGVSSHFNVAELATSQSAGHYLEWTGADNDIDEFAIEVFGGTKTGTDAFGGGNAGSVALTSIYFAGNGANPFA